MTVYADKALRCVACGADFVFTAREQEFHASKGFTNEPRRCPSCRRARRDGGGRSHSESAATAQPAGSTPANGDRRNFTAICSACGGEAILPFEPVGNRPVLCSTCYDKIRTPT